METTVPIFRVFDYAKAVEFYVDWLGFKIDYEYRPDEIPFYMGISLRNIHIDLSEHHGECSPGAKIMVKEFKGLADFHSKLATYRYNKPGLQRSYFNPSSLEMTVTDPFSNRIVFTETVGDDVTVGK